MGDEAAPPTGESTAKIMEALTQYLPAYSQVVNAQKLPTAQADLGVSQAVSPAYAQLMQELYSQYGPGLAKTGSELERINRLGAAGTDVEILQGPGKELVSSAQALDRALNPEYYNTRAAAAGKLGELLGSINLNAPNPEAERLVSQEAARTGNVATPSATSTVSNALSFGNELQKRRSALGQAISIGSQFLPSAVSQFNPVQTALGRPSTNTGISQFTGVQGPSGQSAAQGSDLLGNISALRQQQNQINSQRRDVLDRLNEVSSTIGSVAGSI